MLDQFWLASQQEVQAANAAMLLMLYGMQHHGLTREDALAVVDRMYGRPDAHTLVSAHQVMTAYDEEWDSLRSLRNASDGAERLRRTR